MLETHLEHTGDVRAGVLENGDDVLAAGLGLLGNGALNQIGLSIGRDLARHEDVLTDLDSLGLEGVLCQRGG